MGDNPVSSDSEAYNLFTNLYCAFRLRSIGVLHFIVLSRYHIFYKLKFHGSLASSKTKSDSICSLYAHWVTLEILTIFQIFTLLCLLWWSVISDLDVIIVTVFGRCELCPYTTGNLIHWLCVSWMRFTNWSFPNFPPL